MKSFEPLNRSHVPIECPHCLFDFPLLANTGRPITGDYVLCPECLRMAVYEQTCLRLLSDDEIVDLPPDFRAEILRVIQLSQHDKAHNRLPNALRAFELDSFRK